MVKTSAIKPLTDFLRNSKSHIQNLHASQEPEILTVNGEAAVVGSRWQALAIKNDGM